MDEQIISQAMDFRIDVAGKNTFDGPCDQRKNKIRNPQGKHFLQCMTFPFRKRIDSAVLLVYISTADKKQWHMEIIDCSVVPFIKCTNFQNRGRTHALIEMACGDQNAGKNLDMIDPIIS